MWLLQLGANASVHACLTCLQAAVASAEQQVSSLEAALQQGSQVTLSMTEKVAQTLAASNTQAETFKVCMDTLLTPSLQARAAPG